jgi:hypothetical protein
VAGIWRYVYRAVDQHGQVIDVCVSKKRGVKAATRFFSPSTLEQRIAGAGTGSACRGKALVQPRPEISRPGGVRPPTRRRQI